MQTVSLLAGTFCTVKMQIFVYTPPLPHPNVEFIESQTQTLENIKDLSTDF